LPTKIIEKEIEKLDFQSGGEASSQLKNKLRKLGVTNAIIRKTAIVTYELEMNVVIHSEGGVIEASVSPENLEIIVSDSGPGIKDLDKAFTPGYSTASDEIRKLGFGAGMGLVNVKRYADKLNVETALGQGTVIKVIINFN